MGQAPNTYKMFYKVRAIYRLWQKILIPSFHEVLLWMVKRQDVAYSNNQFSG